MHALMVRIDLHLPAVGSLKAKRSIVQSIVRTVDGWKAVGAAEVAFTDKWQRAGLGFCIVSESADHAGDVADAIERLVWSRPDVTVLSTDRQWAHLEGIEQ